jgi:hypothetical protein
MSRLFVVNRHRASINLNVLRCIALCAMLWIGCKPGPAVQTGSGSAVQSEERTNITPDDVKNCPDAGTGCQQPSANAAKAEWACYGHCLSPSLECYISESATIWQATPGSTISVGIGPDQADVDLSVQDAIEGTSKRPDLWRHVPSAPPELQQTWPSSRPPKSNATIFILKTSELAKAFGITAGTIGAKWPDCTLLGSQPSQVKLSATSITLIGSDHNVTVETSASGKSRSFTAPHLLVILPDHGEHWPATITGISVRGSISANGSGTLDLLDETLVPRQQTIDFTSSSVDLKLTPNGVNRFP